MPAGKALFLIKQDFVFTSRAPCWNSKYFWKMTGSNLEIGPSFNSLNAKVVIIYRNQSIDLLCKSIDWFLYDGSASFLWVNKVVYIQFTNWGKFDSVTDVFIRFLGNLIFMLINTLHASVSFFAPWKHQKIPGILMFSGFIEKD